MRFRILILALGTFAIGTDGFVIAGILPQIARGLHVSVDTTGLLITVFAWTYALGSPVLATMMGKVERKRLLLLSLLAFVGPTCWLLWQRTLTFYSLPVSWPRAAPRYTPRQPWRSRCHWCP